MFGVSDTLYPFYFQPSVSVLVMLQICSRPAVLCSSSIMQFYVICLMSVFILFLILPLSAYLPRTHNKLGDRSFSAASPRLWNDLPPGLRRPGLTLP